MGMQRLVGAHFNNMPRVLVVVAVPIVVMNNIFARRSPQTQLHLVLIQPGCIMNCCREITKMGVPPGNRPALPRDWFRGVPERYVAGGACPEPVEGTPEDVRKDGHIRGRSK